MYVAASASCVENSAPHIAESVTTILIFSEANCFGRYMHFCQRYRTGQYGLCCSCIRSIGIRGSKNNKSFLIATNYGKDLKNIIRSFLNKKLPYDIR